MNAAAASIPVELAPPRAAAPAGDEPALVERVRRGDPAAFDALVADLKVVAAQHG